MKKIKDCGAKILLFDIETAPSKAYMWSLWCEIRSSDFVIDDWFVLCWCAKWLGNKEMISAMLPESTNYKKEPENDREIMVKLRNLLDEADIVVAHNAVKFDCKKVNARFICHNIPVPSPYKVIDTLKIARSSFAFTSNRLDDLGQLFKIGKKLATGGFKLWKGCLEGDKASWDKMLRYCKRDVVILEKLYLKLRPYMKQHPNLGIFTDDSRPTCPKCGSKHIWWEGYAITNAGKYRKFQCQNCGGYGRDKNNILEKTKRVSLTTNVN